jgi:2-polyprenyl-3-methyl-5-hydroxy-6-metoxy-1,4-benzoquinol methylase
MERYETVMIWCVGLAIGIFVTARGLLDRWLSPILAGSVVQLIFVILDLAVSTLGCLLLLRWYKRQRVGCYPSTFVYCFYLPEASNPSGKSTVVGYCHIRPDMDRGELIVHGASFFWENELDFRSRVGFRSTRVYATQGEDDDATCNILFNIDSQDSTKRLYHHGILQFRLTNDGLGSFAPDVYAGYLRSTAQNAEAADIGLQSKGCAEFLSKGQIKESEAVMRLRDRGPDLIARLEKLLAAQPPPALWKDGYTMFYNKTNFWGHRIPTPQSVMLDNDLSVHIEKLLKNVLRLVGLNDEAVQRFLVLARDKARVNADDTRVAYERELKRGLVGLRVLHREGEALAHRAATIYHEIKGEFVGDSMLDIGCGNGLISNLAKAHFQRIQLLDVVNYLQPALITTLPFKPYEDGHPLPVNDNFDTVLLITVLHHSNDPVELLKLAWEVAAKRIIIIESVIGIHHAFENAKYELLALSDEKQIAYAAFVDWFYNRVLHDDIPVPYNFTTPDKWQATFVNSGMRLLKTVHLGQDIEIGPEYHVLFVLEK